MDVEDLLSLCVKQGASDLHVMPALPPMMRLNGDLIPIEGFEKLSHETTKGLVYSIMSEHQLQAFEKEFAIDMSIHFPKIGLFRVSAFHQLRGISAVFRVIPEVVPDFDSLHLPTILKRFSVLSHGLVLVAGATGSGKSTTLAALIDYINAKRACHILTIEDPIEFVYQSKKASVSQIQVGRDCADFATALRSGLRQDPDVILVGEMRDLETIRLALTAAETGHLVLTTLHASTAPLAINRMVDVFPAIEQNSVRTLLAETVQGIICQTLVKSQVGGRVAAFEIMLGIPAIKHYIQQNMVAHMETAIQTNGDIGMCTMQQYLQELVAKGIITPAVARTTSVNRESFQANGGEKKPKSK